MEAVHNLLPSPVFTTPDGGLFRLRWHVSSHLWPDFPAAMDMARMASIERLSGLL
jgi:hypothetical protein